MAVVTLAGAAAAVGSHSPNPMPAACSLPNRPSWTRRCRPRRALSSPRRRFALNQAKLVDAIQSFHYFSTITSDIFPCQ